LQFSDEQLQIFDKKDHWHSKNVNFVSKQKRFSAINFVLFEENIPTKIKFSDWLMFR